MSEWIPVISTLAGGFIGIVGGYVTGAAQTRRQQQTEKKKFLLGKLEETYETAHRSLILETNTEIWKFSLQRVNELKI